MEIALQQNGDFVVTENQTVFFGSQTAHHGFRVIPMDGVEQIADVTVSEQGLQYQQAGASGLQVKEGGESTHITLQLGDTSQETPNTYTVERKDGNLNMIGGSLPRPTRLALSPRTVPRRRRTSLLLWR